MTIRTIRFWGMFILTCIVLMWVAWWNGFPLLFGDTSSYYKTAVTGTMSSYRPSTFALVLLPSVLFNCLWLTVIIQSAITSYLLCRILVLDFSFSLPVMLFTIFSITILTTVSWWVSTVMSDQWCCIVAMCLYLLLFHWFNLEKVERYAISCLFLFSMTMHISAVFITIMSVVLISLLLWRCKITFEKHKLRMTVILVSIIVAGLFYPAYNLIVHNVATPSSGAELLLLARFAADDLIVGLLEERCSDRNYALCDHLSELKEFVNRPPPSGPRNKWPCPCSEEGYINWILIFDRQSPVREVYINNESDDLSQLLIDSFISQPMNHVIAIAEGTVDIYFNSTISPFIDGRFFAGFLKKYSPEEYEIVKKTRSTKGLLHSDTFNNILSPVFLTGSIVSIIIILMMVLFPDFSKQGSQNMLSLKRNAAFFFVFTISNACIMYTFVGDHTRYQSRCSWLVAMQLIFLVSAIFHHYAAYRK